MTPVREVVQNMGKFRFRNSKKKTDWLLSDELKEQQFMVNFSVLPRNLTWNLKMMETPRETSFSRDFFQVPC